MHLLFVDCETTGNGKDPNHDILELSCTLATDSSGTIDMFSGKYAPNDTTRYQKSSSGNLINYTKASSYARKSKKTNNEALVTFIK
jgi:hypothetical protein